LVAWLQVFDAKYPARKSMVIYRLRH